MLSRIHIKNFALIGEASLELSKGLMVFTGETGAGKSILMDAIRFVLGERLDVIRCQPLDASKSTSVEAAFDLEQSFFLGHGEFQEFAEEGEDQVVFRRELTRDSKSKAWINGRQVTASRLRELGSALIDFHGQYDHQMLLEPSNQLELLDRYAGLELELSKYRSFYHPYHELVLAKRALEERRTGREREVDLLKYQIDEIERADLKENEEEELRSERLRLVQSEKLNEHVARLIDILDGGDVSASERLSAAARDMSALARLDPTRESDVKSFSDLHLSLEELIRSIRDYQASLSFEEGRLDEIQARLDQISLLQRKYGKSWNAIQKFLHDCNFRLNEITGADGKGEDLDKKIAEILPQLQASAKKVSQKRKECSDSLKKKIESELKDLGISHGNFKVLFNSGTDLNANGAESVEFWVSLNAGHEPQTLRSLVSAGEVSRLMLALKKTLARVDDTPTLIFDEIDANIGGRLGKVVGQKLKEIAAERQVILITHLPQIASYADRHFIAQKSVKSGKTLTSYRELEGEERVREISQMMSGQETTEISTKHAREMLAKAPR